MEALRGFSITTEIIAKPGGSESDVPKLISRSLWPLGWQETTIQADLLVKLLWREKSECRTWRSSEPASDSHRDGCRIKSDMTNRGRIR